MTDVAVRLLSLINQLDFATRRVLVEFEEDESGVVGYLNRIGFFESLSSNVTVLPKRPMFSAAALYRRRNPSLVEIERIDRNRRDSTLLNRLTMAISRACNQRPDVEELKGAAWTILAELIDNVFSHSQTRLDGFAALQVYPKGNCLKVDVSHTRKTFCERAIRYRSSVSILGAPAAGDFPSIARTTAEVSNLYCIFVIGLKVPL